jgi:hypothetical protein
VTPIVEVIIREGDAEGWFTASASGTPFIAGGCSPLEALHRLSFCCDGLRLRLWTQVEGEVIICDIRARDLQNANVS